MQADIKISPEKTINQLNTRKRRIMAGREDYVLVLEAEN